MFTEANWRALAQAVVTSVFTVALIHIVNWIVFTQ